MVGGQADPPYRIDRAGLHEHPIAGSDQKPPQIVVLRKLIPITRYHQLELMFIPGFRNKIFYKPALLFRRRWLKQLFVMPPSFEG